jgi:hypothetical protein
MPPSDFCTLLEAFVFGEVIRYLKSRETWDKRVMNSRPGKIAIRE